MAFELFKKFFIGVFWRKTYHLAWVGKVSFTAGRTVEALNHGRKPAFRLPRVHPVSKKRHSRRAVTVTVTAHTPGLDRTSDRGRVEVERFDIEGELFRKFDLH